MNLEQNKRNAIAFYQMAYEGNPRKAIETYIGNEYIQHNPDVADGTEGLMTRGKFVSIGIPSSRFLHSLRIPIPCTKILC